MSAVPSPRLVDDIVDLSSLQPLSKKRVAAVADDGTGIQRRLLEPQVAFD